MVNTSTFEHNGETYHADPDMETFLDEAGFKSSMCSRIETYLDKVGVRTVARLINMKLEELEEINGISDKSAERIHSHIKLVKLKGDIVQDFAQLKSRETHHSYLPTGSSMLDEMFQFSDGNVGLRSRTLIELYGGPSMGKTQLCMTAAAMCMRSPELGGWGRGVAYIDSEGAFEGLRMEYLARYWGVEREFLENNLFYSRVTDFDSVEMAINEIMNKTADVDIGLIIVDSIIDPLKAQYLVGGQHLSNLQPRQQHLKQVLDKLKSLAEINNAIAMYTNHIRAEVGNMWGPSTGPQGGLTLGHASDIRIELSSPTKKEKEFLHKDAEDYSIKAGRAKIVDCGFLPEGKGFYLIGPMGIADPRKMKIVIDHAKKIKEKGYICVNALGEDLPPIGEDVTSLDDNIKLIQEQLYG